MIFVTGGSGLLGSHLLLELSKKNEKILALKRSDSNMADIRKLFHLFAQNPEMQLSKIQWIEGDLLDYFLLEECLQQTATVYHCAASVSFAPGALHIMKKINGEGTANLVDAAIAAKVNKFCHVSSIASLGRAKSGAQIDEKNPMGALFKKQLLCHKQIYGRT
jgi:dihydroflavonol-4-reductase